MGMDEQAKPTKKQYEWQDMEFGMFVHFGLYTFHDNAFPDGTAPIQIFNPSSLDCRQWARIAKRMGAKYLVLTAKHHEGFCLWPTETTDYSVKSSPWKDGRGDVVGECADACQAEGIGFGLYLSPWDIHEPCYQDPRAYDAFYARQLTELMTSYGPLVEIWFDGYCESAREEDYDWELFMGLIDRYQPDAMVFNMGRPTIRWAGNEDGVAPYPCWNVVTEAKLSMFYDEMTQWLPGTRLWVPAECDVPIRRSHWAWQLNEEHSLFSLDELVDKYLRSVGHGANLLLNLAPDRRGLIPEADENRAMELGEKIKNIYANQIAMISGTGDELTLDMGGKTEIGYIVLMEEIAYGERVRRFFIDSFINGIWEEVLSGTAIGHKLIFPVPGMAAEKLRLRIVEAAGEAIIRSFTVYS